MNLLNLLKFPTHSTLREEEVAAEPRPQVETTSLGRAGSLPPGIRTPEHWDAVLELTQGMLKLVAVPEIHGPPALWDPAYPSAGAGTHPNHKPWSQRGLRPVDHTLGVLHGKGFTVLANGYFGAVVEHPLLPEGLVIKVGIEPDDAWPDYARWCRAHPEYWDAGALPVYHLSRPAHARGAYVAVLPKLRELSSFAQGKYKKLADTATAWAARVEVLIGDHTYRKRCDSLISPRALEFLSALSSFFYSTVDTDLHLGNFMAGGPDHDPALIITDPFGWSTNPIYDED